MLILCPTCKTENKRGGKFCIECGSPLASGPLTQPYADTFTPQEPAPESGVAAAAPPPPRARRGNAIATVLLVLLVAVAGVAAFSMRDQLPIGNGASGDSGNQPRAVVNTPTPLMVRNTATATATATQTRTPTVTPTKTLTPSATATQVMTPVPLPTITPPPPTATPFLLSRGEHPLLFVFTLCSEGNCDLWLYDGNSPSPIPIVADPRVDKQAAWSPDGRSLVFSKMDEHGIERLAIFSFDSNQVYFVGDTEEDKVFPVWSPDGSEIAYQQYGEETVEIWALNTSNGQRRMMSHAMANWNKAPQWSLDGSRIAFSAASRDSNDDGYIDDSDERHLFVMNRDGRGIVQLTREPEFYDMYPFWLPDGRTIVFSRHTKAEQFRHNGAGDIYLVDSLTGETRPLSLNATDEVMAVPSPDGKQMLIVHERNGLFQIHLASWDGRNLGTLRYLTDGTVPAWAPQ